MKKQHSLKLNFIMNALLTISAVLFPLISFPYVSRVLLPEGTGKISLATSVVAYFSMFAQLGIPTYGISACAKVRDNKEELSRTVHEILAVNAVVCVIVYAAFFVALAFVPKLAEERGMYLILGATILLNMIGVEWLYKGLEEYTYITIRSLVFKVIALIAMFLLVRSKSDYIPYAFTTILAASASNLLNFINLRKYIYLHPVGNYHFTRHLRMIFLFFAMSVATTIYTNLDTVMLGFMKTDTDVGYYNAAVKIKSILVGVITSLGTVLLPRAAYYVENGSMDEFYRIARKALNFVCLLAAPLALYFLLFAREGVLLLSGEAFAGAILPMQIIMPTLLLIGLTNVMGIQMMIPLGMEKQLLYSEIAGAVTDLILNAVLIPRYGAAGAAAGTLAAEAAVFLWQYVVMRTKVRDGYRQIHYGTIGIGLVLGTAASLWVLRLNLSSFLTLAISAVCFFGCYGLVLLLEKEPFVMELLGQINRKLKE